MSQFGSSGPGDARLAGGYVDLYTRGDEAVKAAVTSTAATVQTQTAVMAQATEQSAARQNVANESAVRGWKQFSSGITSTIASMTALAAVVGTVTRAITGLFTSLQRSNQETANFLRAVDTTNVQRGLSDIQQRLSALNERNAFSSFRKLLDDVGVTGTLGFRTLREEIDMTQDAARRLGNVLTQRGNTEPLDRYAEQVDALERMLHRKRRERMREEFDERRQRIREEAEERRRLEEEIAAFDQRRRQSMLQNFQATVKALESAMESAQRRQDSFNQRQVVALERVVESVNAQERRLLALRGQWPGGTRP